jgi:hypothetical protein
MSFSYKTVTTGKDLLNIVKGLEGVFPKSYLESIKIAEISSKEQTKLKIITLLETAVANCKLLENPDKNFLFVLENTLETIKKMEI